MIGSPIGIDDEIGFEVRARRLDEDMDTLGGADAARRITDDPADRIASRHRTGADQLLAFLQPDLGHLTRGAIDLIERAVGLGILLDGVEPGRDRKSTRLNSRHYCASRFPSSA